MGIIDANFHVSMQKKRYFKLFTAVLTLVSVYKLILHLIRSYQYRLMITTIVDKHMQRRL